MLFYAMATLFSVLFGFLYQTSKNIQIETLLSSILKRSNVIFFFLAFLSLFVISAFRVNVGIDYPSYVTLFNEIYTYDFSYFEPGFRAMIGIIQIFTNDPQWLFIVSSVITLGSIFIAIKKYSMNPALSIFLFCTMGFLSHSLNLTRQFIAIAIILYAYGYIIDRKLIKYIVTVIIAALFHKTALIMLPIYFLLRLKLRPVHYVMITLISAAIGLFQTPIINNLVINFYPQYYDQSFVGDRIISVYYIVLCFSLLISVIYLLTIKKMTIKKDEDRVIVNAIFLVTLAHIFFVWIPLSNRVSLYIDIMLILIIPKLHSYVYLKLNRYILLLLMCAYFIWAGYVSLQKNANGVLPYSSSILGAAQLNNNLSQKAGIA